MASKDLMLPGPTLSSSRKPLSSLKLITLGLVASGSISFLAYNIWSLPNSRKSRSLPPHALESLSKCRSLNLKPGPPEGFLNRSESERWEPGDHGNEVVLGDILLDKGMTKAVGRAPSALLNAIRNKLVVKNVEGAWVSPAINDMHSHLGVYSVPELRADDNSLKAPTMPYLRSLDGLDTHDAAFALSRSGGVATALILPGSTNNIGGQAFVVKIRKTSYGGPSSMILEPPVTLYANDTRAKTNGLRWRHMKHACGENPSRVHKQTRMDSIWEFRKAYNSAREVKQKQDDFCYRAGTGAVDWSKESFPDDLQFEALVDVLRGRVKVNIHCYQAVDFDGIVRVTNEFKFPVAAFHHAHDAYLVPTLIKSAWGDVPPAVALFATDARYKNEAYRGSEFAPKILHDNGLRIIIKSDHPILNSRYLLYEATEAHYYGLPTGPALSSVITTPAEIAGFGHRLGRLQNGYDADVAVWDSHPLSLGATPQQLYIDGIAQLSAPVVVTKPRAFQRIPATPNWGNAAEEAIKHDGLPPLHQSASGKDQARTVVFTRVKSIWSDISGELKLRSLPAESVVVVSGGRVTCAGSTSRCSTPLAHAKVVDLAYGSLSPGFISFGAPLGLEEIEAESSTNDGRGLDPLFGEGVPEIAGGDELVIRAVDGLSFAGRSTLLAHRAGVTTAVSAPVSRGFFSGASVAFRTGAAHKLERGAVVNPAPAFHVCVRNGSGVSVSTQITTLRRLLLKNAAEKNRHGLVAKALDAVPLVITVHKADDMVTLLKLKAEIEDLTSVPLRVTFAGATEAHLVAKEIAAAGVGVIVIPTRSFPASWDQARILPGPPLSRASLITRLFKANVTVGVGVVRPWDARNTRFNIAWAALESNGDLTKQDALALGTINLQKLLGLEGNAPFGDLVAYRGGDCFDLASRPVAVVSSARATVDLF
ncbi:DNA-directed RNA polymerase II subunit RPB1-B [Rhizoctonia solani]|uniref:DNA-directed RNA polymerase II subunit RPB1-B n=1 Tax=Rhizoctonia solani TaxID=456999 RepID=A0A0K6G861_9AGAM|nr:DNA-directed RNA polymerase II subunit RPB1-B [Rhizoctonia solani]